ncbi:hypothetical protein SCHPADRAFT_398349 [Schizopora paradoxa]|uniref:DUF6593 domain-containing protein n=1 Tax=Schizopora paradoxa TaxID=27342 RepID=A0A0H2RLQ9_9AGAM|nr:hypothetical protein SCHPADRAFT_398349 [Schizopora paradoxa]
MQAFGSGNNDVLNWTSDDPRQSHLFGPWGVVYRFQTDTNRGTTTLLRATRTNKEDKVARLEWSSSGGLGRAVIGKVTVPMIDLVKPDPRNLAYRTFFGPDGLQYRWRPSGNGSDVVLEDPYGSKIACLRPTRPTRYPIGDVHFELHFYKSTTSVLLPPLMDTITVTAMLYRFCMAYGL